MDTALAFMMGEAHRNNRLMVFDWDKAAQIIAERKPEIAFAGLEGDEEYTMGVIWRDGKPEKNDYTYLASTWATPTLYIDCEEIECWCCTDKWDSDTKWPMSALKIVEEAR